MDFNDRLESYANRHADYGQAVGIVADGTEADHSWLTPGERRRLRRKRNSPKSHTHRGLLVAENPDGTFSRQPCARCSPPRKLKKLVGGAS